jgi:quinoprotein glucose dehydrogenase
MTKPSAALFAASLALAAQAPPTVDCWPAYGDDAGGARYSPLTQITRDSVPRLKVAWTFHTGDMSDGAGGTAAAALRRCRSSSTGRCS